MLSCSELFTLAGNLQNSIQTGSLSLSTVITYHSTQPPLCDPSGPSILTTPLISDSPPNLNPRSSLPRVGDCGFESAIEIDLFDGMGRDVSVSLTRPLTTAGNSNSAYQVEPTQNPQSKRPGSTAIRYSHSHSIPKITSGLVNPSRSDDYLPTFPEERSQTAHPIHAARRAFSNSYSKESTPIILTPQEIEPSASGVPFLDKKLTTIIPIVDPFILKVDTIAPQHRLKPRELTVDQLNHPEIGFIEMEQLSNPMLTLELCYQGDVIGTFDEEFLVESLDVKLEEQGLLPEFDNFFTSTIKIMPIHPTQPSGDNFPYRVSRNEVYSWIYMVQIDRADTLSEQAPHYDSSFSQYGSPSVNIISLPPSTLISSVRSAFKHQKTGIPIVDEGLHVSEDENLSNSPAAGRADDTQGTGSSGWGSGKPHITTRGLRNSYQRGLDNLPESEVRLSSENEHQKPAGVFYLLSITIFGKIISKDSRIESTGPISATWTSLLSSHDLTDSTTLDLRRKLNNESSEAAAMSWSGDEQAEKLAVTDLILPEAYGIGQPLKRSVLPHSGLVAGSKRHTASNLINALQELSSFQRSTYAAGLPLTLERSRTQQKQLSPLAIRHDSEFVQQRALSDDPSFTDSLTSASLSMMNSGRRFIPNTRQRTPTSAASHSSPQLPEPAHQPSEIDPKTGAGYPGDFKSNTPRGPPRASKRVPPVLIGSSFAQELHTSRSGALDDGTGRGQGDMMIQVNVSSPNGGDGTNRFKLMSEFAVEIIVFNRSSSSIIAQGPFKVKVLTNDYLLRAPHVSLQSGSPEAARQPYLFASVPPVHGDAGHHANASAGSGCAGGIVSLDEDIQIGPLRNGECQAVKIRLIGLKPGIFQLHGIHFVALPQPPPPPAPSHHHHHHHHQSQQQLSQFILVDPLVILIE